MMSTLKVIAFETERITVNNKMFMGYQKYLEEFIKIFLWSIMLWQICDIKD